MIEIGILLEAHDKASKEIGDIAEKAEDGLGGAALAAAAVSVAAVAAGLEVANTLYDIAKFGAEAGREMAGVSEHAKLTELQVAQLVRRADEFDESTFRMRAGLAVLASEVTERVNPYLGKMADTIKYISELEVPKGWIEFLDRFNTDAQNTENALTRGESGGRAAGLRAKDLADARRKAADELSLQEELENSKWEATKRRLDKEAKLEADAAKRAAEDKARHDQRDLLREDRQREAMEKQWADRQFARSQGRERQEADSRLQVLQIEAKRREDEVNQQLAREKAVREERKKATEETQRQAEAVGSLASEYAGTLVQGLIEGAKAGDDLGESIANVASTIGEQLLTSAIINGVGLLATFLSGGAAMPIGKVIGALFGAHRGGRVPGFASGGQVGGGFPGRDSVFARLEPGEVVIPTHVVEMVRNGRDPATQGGGARGSRGPLSLTYVTNKPMTLAEQDHHTMTVVAPSLRRLGLLG